MSKELEALKNIDDIMEEVLNHSNIIEGGLENWGYYDSLNIVRKALTPPTQEEVCKEIEKFLNTKHKVIFNNKTKLFEIPDWDVYDVLNNTIFGFQNEIQDLPPHLITLIGRFYEGLGK